MTKSTIFPKPKAQEAAEMSDLAMWSKSYWGYAKEFMEACREELTVTPENINSHGFHYVIAEHKSKLAGYYAIEKIGEFEYELEALFVGPAHIGTDWVY